MKDSSPPSGSVIEPGLTRTAVSVWLTTTVTLLVAVSPLGSLTVTRKVYDPAAEKVAVTLWAALVPLAL